MALKTITIGQIRKMLNGIPDEQKFLIVKDDGLAYAVHNLDPLTSV